MIKIYRTLFFLVATLVLFSSCATSSVDYGKNAINFERESIKQDSTIHTFYLLGDAGNLSLKESSNTISILKDILSKASEHSTLLFLGDNIYPKGLPEKTSSDRDDAERKLDNQLLLTKDFAGKTVFIPGNHDWYSNGIVGLKRQEDYLVEKTNDPTIFAPKNGCAIETRRLNKEVALILVDTEWVLADWNKNPGINEKCKIKTREDFYTELEDQLNKNQNRTVVLAAHHPLFTHGSHGGYFSWKSQLYPLDNKVPLPIIGSLANLLRSTSGITHQDNINPEYKDMADRIKTLIGGRNNVVVVSGHDHTLQFLDKNGIKQIISGSASKTGAAKAVDANDFTYGKNGYAVLDIKKSGSADVRYYSLEEERAESKLLFRTKILENEKVEVSNHYQSQFPEFTTSSVYDSAFTKKSKFYKFLWGEHYRDYYSKDIKARTLDLDTIYGGAKPARAGGGHQTKSLRLEAENGQEYAMRALKKSGVRFLQSVAFKKRYVVEDFKNTFADRFLLDFYTTSHPYTPLAVGKMGEYLGIRHTNPELFYIPKQNALGKFDQDFGDELYYLEIRPSETKENPNEVLNTDEVLANLIKDEKYVMDEKAWIKVRLFDMLIGDWDRHEDQWKFEERKENGQVIYTPIPKDRDQAFTKYDGIVTAYLMSYPELKHMQNFGNKLESVKWFNREPYPMDLAFTKSSTEEDWIKQAQFIQEELTEDRIRLAFKNMPIEVQDKTSEEIIQKLLIRKNDLQKYAKDYHNFLLRKVLLSGTNKKDKFVITRLPNKQTEVKIFRMKKSGEELVFSKVYSKKTTKEIWLYALSEEDFFVVDGVSGNHIKVRLFGSLDRDHYQIENGENVRIYDYASHQNVWKKNDGVSVTLTDDYNINHYDYKRPKYSSYSNTLIGGYNPDDEFIIGFENVFTVNNFIQNPYSSKHFLKTNYFSKTNGYEIAYHGIFPKITGNWFYQLEARITSSHYIRNFFGIGNDSYNPGKLYGDTYNSVRAQEMGISPSFNWKDDSAMFSAKIGYEALRVDETDGRFVRLPGVVDPIVFDTQHYASADFSFVYENYDNKANPKRGMKFDINTGWKFNLDDVGRHLPYLDLGLGFLHYLTNNQKLVWSTYAKAKWLFNDEYVFYQMAMLGGNNNLRGFDFNRFYGKNSFYQTSDLIYELGDFKNSFTPISFSVFAGFDLGRVWVPNEFSDKWHSSLGGGLMINILDTISMKASYFKSTDGGRLMVGIGGSF